MPYAPGITDRSGEILAQGISSLGNNFGDVLRFFGQQRREKEELMGMLGGAGASAQPPAGTESNPAPMDLSMFGVPEGPDEGTGEGEATAEDKAKSAAAVTKAMRTLGQHAYGYDRNTLETMSTDQLRGLMRRSEYQAVQQEHQQRTQLNAAHLKQLMGDAAAQDRFNKAVQAAGMDAGADPSTLDAGTLMKLAVKSGLPMKQTLEMGQALHALAQANPNAKDYAPTSTKISGRDVVYSPHTGAFQVMPDGSGEASPYIDPDTLEPVPGLVNIGGKPVRLPTGPDAAQARKRGMETLLEGEKALSNIDTELSAYHNRLERSKADKSVKPFDPSRLEELTARRANILKAMRAADAGEAATAAAPEAKVKRGERVTTLPDPAMEANPEALAIKAAFQAGKITKAEAKKKLQELGF